MSAPRVLDYVDALRARLPGGGGAEGGALHDAAAALQAAIDDPAAVTRPQWDALVAEFGRRRDAMVGRLADALLAAVPIDEARRLLAAADWDDPGGFTAEPALGPLRVRLSAPPLGARLPNDPSSFAALAPQLPDTLAGTLDAGPARGGGALRVLPGGDGLAGALTLGLGTVEVSALGSLRRAHGGTPSFLAVLGVSFVPGIQLSFGFSLSRVGGLVGVNRTADVDALAAGLRGGTLGDVLFASDPLAEAARLLAALDLMFPPAPGRHLVGPTLRISWLQVAGGALFDLDLGVIVELPGPSRIVLAGSARAELPGLPPLLRLRIDVLGVIDFGARTVAFDATLVDSSALGVFVITGDAAFRLRWGDSPTMILSIGGFYPGFQPPPGIPALSRVGLALESPLPLPLTLRADGYLAVTPNTLQLGAHVEVGFGAGLTAVGSFGVDALIQFTPFHFQADFYAGFRVEAGGFTIGGVRLDGTIDGPGPIVISGRLTIETFLFDVSWHETFTLPGSGGGATAPPIRLLDRLAPELARRENLRSLAGADREVVLRPRPPTPGTALASPAGELAWTQRLAPLAVPVDRVAGEPLGSRQEVRVESPAARRPDRALFSPGSFCSLTQAEALNRPTFEELDGGSVLGWDEAAAAGPGVTPQPAGMKVYRSVRGEGAATPLADGAFLLAPLLVLLGLDERHRPAAVSDRSPHVAVAAEAWRTTLGSEHASATAAHQVALAAGAVAFAAADADRPVDLAGV